MIEIFFILFIATSNGADINLLTGKSLVLSSNQYYSSKINDGDFETCVSIHDQTANWIVIDLKNVTRIRKIVIKGHYARDKDPISFLVGDDFQQCHFHNQYKKYKLCKSLTLNGEGSDSIECNEGANIGQYLALFKGDFKSEKIAERLFLCDLELYGDVLRTGVQELRPEVQSEPISAITADHFPISKEIRRGVSEFTIPYNSQSFSYFSNCQPLIWDMVTNAVFSLVCTTDDGLGRLVTFAKNHVFDTLKSDDPLKVNLVKWLSPNSKTPKIIGEDDLSTMEDLLKVKKGDIVDIDTRKEYPPDVLSSMKAMIRNGSIAVVLDWTLFAGTTENSRKAYSSILEMFQVVFNEKYITRGKERLVPLRDEDMSEDLLGLDEYTSRIGKSSLFFKRASIIDEKIASVPLDMLIKSNIKSSLQSIIAKYTPLLEYICPCKASPAINIDDRKFIDALSGISLNQILVNSNFKMPCVDLFPGDFDSSPPKKSISLQVQGQTDSTFNPIGYYLEAGSTLKYDVVKSVGEWSLRVGCHTDHLNDDRPGWDRYPNIVVDKVKLDSKGEVYSPFGGVLWLYNEKKGDSIRITMSNVVATPFFNLRDKNAAYEWDIQRNNNPGLWSVIAGDNIVFCEKSSKVRSYSGKYLENLMTNYWDKLVKSDHAIKSQNWKDKRPEIAVLDIMISYGYGHAGYPIEVYDDWHWKIFDEVKIKSEGYWGMCHEIGHNMQESKWNFAGVGEVTNNLFCLFNYDKLLKMITYGHSATEMDGETNRILTYLNSTSVDFNGWTDNPWISLALYSQMANNFGWGFYKKVFGYYENNIESVSGTKEKIAMWQNVTCRISKQNLSPMFEFWGVPMDEAVKKEVSKLPCFFPDDFFRTMGPKRTDFILSKYGDCNGKSTFYEDYDPTVDIVGIRPNFIEELS